jgi:hypothetical protein
LKAFFAYYFNCIFDLKKKLSRRMSQEISDNVTNEKLMQDCFKRLTQIEQTVFIIDNLNVLSASLIKFLISVCIEFLENQTLNTSDARKETEANQYSSILEEQANDLSIKSFLFYSGWIVILI